MIDIENLRNLPSPEKTDLSIVSIQYFIDRAEDNVQKELEEINLEDIIHKALFLIPQNYSVGESRISQAGQILAAVSGTQLYIVKEYFNPIDTQSAKRTLAHEITHLLQSQFKSPQLTTSDQRWAWISLIEGDADFTADTYATRSGLFSYNLNSLESLDKIRSFPYTYGSNFISALYEKDGWNQINQAYINPPRSTAEILHPELFLENVSILNVNALIPNSNEWKVLLTETYGEHFIRVMLENGISNEEAIVAAAGWNGGNLSLFNKGESYLVTWSVNWATLNDSSEYIESYANMIKNIGGKIVEPDLYYCNDHYVILSKKGTMTQIASSTDKEIILSIMHLIMP
ncbi:hypothetical protein ACFL96_09875 [Thermoproteota archaeon]